MRARNAIIGALAGGSILGSAGAYDNFRGSYGKNLSTKQRIKNTARATLTGAGIGGLLAASLPTSLRNTRPYPKSPKPKYPKGPKHEAAKRWGMKESDIIKEAMYNAFADELVKIAMVGALAGGAAGYALAPGGIKGKLVGTALGAGAGAAVGSVAQGAKKSFWDEPRRREQAELYNYVPGGTNGY